MPSETLASRRMVLSSSIPTEVPMVEDSAADPGLVLLRRTAAGDAAAFADLVRREQAGLLRVALRYARDVDDAHDLVQRAFLRAFQGAGAFRGDCSVRAWLVRITMHLGLNFVRDRKRTERLDDVQLAALEAVPGSDDPAAAHDARLRSSRLREVIRTLPPKQRLVVELRVEDGLPFRDVAAIAECSEESAKVNFHHAVRRLRERMQGDA
jgi:RNA polymerase sigma-70 factor (ECF subfamily)